MKRSVPDVDLCDVERQIGAGFKWLRFSGPLERQFDRDVGHDRCRYMKLQNLIGLVIYHCFLYSDYRAIGDVFEFDLFVHFLVVTPLLVLTNSVLSRDPPAWIREGFQTGALIIVALTIMLVAMRSQMPDRDIVHFTIALVVAFATIMLRIRFWYILAGCIVMLALYVAGLMSMTPFSVDRAIMSVFVFLGIVVFSLVGSYNLEHEQRTRYLLTLRDSFRNRDLEIASLRDALTGVGNRRALDIALSGLVAKRMADPLRSTAVLLLDIDHFKLFNDTNGHQEGDRCLKRVAELLVANLRGGEDKTYRFGGEEFLILLDGTTLDDATVVAERLLLAVVAERIAIDPATDRFVTVSIGVAAGCLDGNAISHSVIALADRALYAAKHEGRNRVVSDPGPRSISASSASLRLLAS